LITQYAQAERRTGNKWEDNIKMGFKELSVAFESHVFDFEKYCLVGLNSVESGRYLQTFYRNLLLSFPFLPSVALL
jgi:hypothetical protein